MTDPILHGYWRSSAAYRVRIALHLKGVAHAQVTHDLRAGEQRGAGYLAMAPHGLVPALDVDGRILIESPAILDYIETRWPEPALLPADPIDAATVRGMAALVGCDIHPINNLRVLKRLKRDFGASQAQIDAWVAHWIAEGFAALEILIGRHGGSFAFGDTPTLADCYILPQAYNAERFAVDLSPFPELMARVAAARALPAIAAAHPAAQPDATE